MTAEMTVSNSSHAFYEIPNRKGLATLFANTRIEHHVSTAFMQLIMCMT